MQVQIEEVNSVQRRLVVDVPQEFVDKSYDTALRSVRGKVSIPGYRKGKAPLYLIKSQYGASLKEDVLSEIMKQFSAELARLDLAVVGRPEVEADPDKLQSGAAYQFAVLCDIEPQFELGEKYKGLKLTKPDIEPTEASFDRALLQIQRDKMQLESEGDKTVDGLALTAHRLVRFEQLQGKVGEEAMESNIFARNDYLIGFDSKFGTNLDEKLAELKVEEEFVLEGETSDNLVSQSFSGGGESYELKGKVTAIESALVPECNEEFAKSLGEESLEALHTRVRNDLDAWAKNKADQFFRGSCLASLREQYSFELPPVVVDSQIDAMIIDRMGSIFGDANNPEVKKILQSMLQAEEIRSSLRDEAKIMVQNTYILRKVAEAEGINASEGAGQVADDKQIMQTYDKALDKVMSFADITVEKVPLD